MKYPKRDELVVMATCSKYRQPFGIRAVNNGNAYVFEWAFKIDSNAAEREGYESNTVRGNIVNSSEYPGCPYCGAETWYQCGNCDSFNCNRIEKTRVTCPVCGESGELIACDNFKINGGQM